MAAPASPGPPQQSGSATELKPGGPAASQKLSLLGWNVRVVTELDDVVVVLVGHLEEHVLDGVLVDRVQRVADGLLLGELAGGRLDLVPLLSGLSLRLGDVLGAFRVLISVVEVFVSGDFFFLFWDDDLLCRRVGSFL